MKGTYIAFTAALITGALLVIFAPYNSVTPGVLTRGHESFKNDCYACHDALAGPSSAKCMNCHKKENIGVKTVSGSETAKKNVRSNLLHKSVNPENCFGCHTEHNGASREDAILKFSHSLLEKSLQKQCYTCHKDQKPEDKLHKLVNNSCSDCHNTESWKCAGFNHSLVKNADLSCTDCHAGDKPEDDLHKGLTADTQCSKCHSTEAWKPSSYDHSKYFLFDGNHPSDCSGCHTPGQGFKAYTCYNCHEHSPAKIAEKHREEGISDFENCVKCHRSGNEHDVKGGGEGGDREGKKERKHGGDKREGEHDDD